MYLGICIHGPLKAIATPERTTDGGKKYATVKLKDASETSAPITIFMRDAVAAELIAHAINAAFAEKPKLEAVG